MALNTAFAVLPGLTLDELPDDVLDVTGDAVTGEEAMSNVLPAGYIGAFETSIDDEPTVVLVGYELMVQPDLIPELADEAVTAVFAASAKTWLLIVDSDGASRMLTMDHTGITAEDGEPVEGEPEALLDNDPEKTLVHSLAEIAGVTIGAIIASTGQLAVVVD